MKYFCGDDECVRRSMHNIVTRDDVFCFLFSVALFSSSRCVDMKALFSQCDWMMHGTRATTNERQPKERKYNIINWPVMWYKYQINLERNDAQTAVNLSILSFIPEWIDFAFTLRSHSIRHNRMFSQLNNSVCRQKHSRLQKWNTEH